MIDLHLHTYYSDGTWSPSEVVERAASLALSAISIVDHDGVGGIPEALESCSRFDIHFIPGIEISTAHRAVETHVLGYYIDYKSNDLINQLEKIASTRFERVAGMIELLNNRKGLRLEIEDLVAFSPKGYYGRPHIAKALVAKKYIERASDAFTDELIGDSGDCFLPTDFLSVTNAIELIKRVGGLPVLAHPGFWGGPGGAINEGDIADFAACGLMGIECRHFRHSTGKTKMYEKIANKLGLLKTGGSDCHGDYYDPVKIGTVAVPDEWFELIYEKDKTKGGVL